MPLVNLTTNLKSLRYGKDVLGGGNSNQPYITTSIPESLDDIGRTGGPDFLLRGGTLLPRRIGNDVSRLTQMFFDFKSPNGPLFIAKQNVLSLTNVNSEAGFKSPARLIMNQGVYTPLEAIIQAGTNAIGIHVPKQGYNPFDNLNPNGPKNFGFESHRNKPLAFPTYLRTINKDKLDGNGEGRLANLAGTKIYSIGASNPKNQNLLSYLGGPGSTLGVGKTKIPITSRTTFSDTDVNFYGSGTSNAIGKSSLSYNQLFQINTEARGQFNNAINILNTVLFRGNSNLNTSTSEERIPASKGGVSTGTQFGDFSTATNPNFQQQLGPSQTRPASLAWQFDKQIEQRVNLGNPGKRGNLISYTIGKTDSNTTSTVSKNSGYQNAVDKINAFPLYKSSGVTGDTVKNDLVKFRIGVIDNDTPSEKTYIHFRAFINSFSDSYTSNWEAQKFMGRSEDFYRYSGFGRTVSLDWTVAAQSKQELIPMYQKLNYLASVCAGDYSDVGYMRGNLISLTVGGWFQEQVGIMQGLTLEVPSESPWEIGITDANNLTSVGSKGKEINSDPSVKEMPMIVNVTGFTFIPIHNFVPRVQRNGYNGSEDGVGFISKYGDERFINLNNGLGSNYEGKSGNIDVPNGSLNYMPLKSGV